MPYTAVCPGSYDPMTYGHLDIINRASRLVDKLIVAILDNSRKTPLFTVEERRAQLLALTAHLTNIEVDAFSGLLVEYARSRQARMIVRGLRNNSDYDFEMQMALANRSMAPEIETVLIPASTQHVFVSSSFVKEIAGFGGRIDDIVPPLVREQIGNKLNRSV